MLGLSRAERDLARLEREARTAELEARKEQVRNAAPGFGALATVGLSDPDAWFNLFRPAAHGVTAQTAMTHAAVYRCVFLIAASVSMLTFRSYRAAGTPDEAEDFDSPQARLIRERPNPRYARAGFWRSVVADMLLNGNGIVWIERNGAGLPLNLWWIPWPRVGVFFVKNPITGETALAYNLTLDDGRLVRAWQDDVLHFGGSPYWNLLFYTSPVTAYAQTVGIALDSERFAGAYYRNGTVTDSYVTFTGKKTPDQAKEYRARLQERYAGGNAFSGPMMLDDGGEIKQLKINAADAQIIEARGFNVDNIGMIFGVPPHLLNRSNKATSFGKGLEELTQSYIDFSVGPHLDAIEDEVNWKLYGQRARAARFDRDSFIRGDLKSRAEAMQILLGGAQGPGVASTNEARAKLGMPRKRGAQYDSILAWGAAPPKTGPADPVPKPLPDPLPADPAAAAPAMP